MATEDLPRRVAALETRVTTLEAAVTAAGLGAVASNYPEPLAVPLARAVAARFHHEKFFSLLDAGEVLVQYTGVIAIALSRAAGRQILVREEFKRPVSLGRWAELVRQILAWNGFATSTIGQKVKSSLVRQNGRPTSSGRYFFDEFISIRNRERGHGSSLPEQAYEALYLRNKDQLHDALESCDYLKYTLARVEAVDVTTEPISYDVRLLVGSATLNRTARIQSTAKIPVEAVCIWDGSEQLLNLGDLVMYRVCPTCHLEHTFFLEKWAGEVRHYHSYVGNHRLQI